MESVSVPLTVADIGRSLAVLVIWCIALGVALGAVEWWRRGR